MRLLSDETKTLKSSMEKLNFVKKARSKKPPKTPESKTMITADTLTTVDTLKTAKSKHQLPLEIMAKIIAECGDRRTLAALERASSATRDAMEWHGSDSLWLAACRNEFGAERTTWNQNLKPGYSVKEVYRNLVEPDFKYVEETKAEIEVLELKCILLLKKMERYELVTDPFQKINPRGAGVFDAATFVCRLLTLPVYVPSSIFLDKARAEYQVAFSQIANLRRLLPSDPRMATDNFYACNYVDSFDRRRF